MHVPAGRGAPGPIDSSQTEQQHHSGHRREEKTLAGDLLLNDVSLLKQLVSHSQKAYLIVLFMPIKTTKLKIDML